jgi:predicted metalloprotease with PDZ domain
MLLALPAALPLALLLAGVPPADTVSAPIHDVRYELTFTRAQAELRVVDVSMTFATTGTGAVLLSLPAWTPGAYQISNFARWVTGFEASSLDASSGDRGLSWDKLDFDTWRIRPAGAKSIRVSFRYVADTLDNAMSWSTPDFLLINGTNVFLFPQGQSAAFASTVMVRTDAAWRVATSMTPTAVRHIYTAANYHDLVDMPFFIGRFDLDSVQTGGRTVRLATYPSGAVAGQARQLALAQLQHVIPPEIAVFGTVPWTSYTVMEIVDPSFGGASGLEHQSSHVDVVAPSYVGSELQPSLYAHEIFHSWNVKRLRPADMWPYAYDRAQPTPWLWVSEGVTDYYADLAEVRGGVIDDRGFYALAAGKINQVAAVPAVSLQDASLDTWIQPVDGSEYLYYPKGSLAGLALDILIRDASNNARSLDDVMRVLYHETYEHSRGFTATEWWSAVSAAAGGRSFADFEARYVDGRAEFPWDSVLALAGMKVNQPRVPRLGVLTREDSAGVLVANVQEGGSAAAAGVEPGDYLVSVGDVAITDQDFSTRLRTRYGASMEGAPLPIVVRRNGATLSLSGKLQFGAGEVTIEPDSAASAKAVRIRNGILRGVTGA